MKREEIAGLLFMIDMYDEYDSLEDGVNWWKKVYEAKDSEHCGDCIKVPMTCGRCVVEDYLDQANNFGWHVVEAVTDAIEEKHERCECGHLKPDHFLPNIKDKEDSSQQACLSCDCPHFGKLNNEQETI